MGVWFADAELEIEVKYGANELRCQTGSLE